MKMCPNVRIENSHILTRIHQVPLSLCLESVGGVRERLLHLLVLGVDVGLHHPPLLPHVGHRVSPEEGGGAGAGRDGGGQNRGHARVLECKNNERNGSLTKLQDNRVGGEEGGQSSQKKTKVKTLRLLISIRIFGFVCV